MKQNRTWIVVADGAKARVLLYKPHQKGVQQLPDGEFHDSHLPTHELVTDRQPRVHEFDGQPPAMQLSPGLTHISSAKSSFWRGLRRILKAPNNVANSSISLS